MKGAIKGPKGPRIASLTFHTSDGVWQTGHKLDKQDMKRLINGSNGLAEIRNSIANRVINVPIMPGNDSRMTLMTHMKPVMNPSRKGRQQRGEKGRTTKETMGTFLYSAMNAPLNGSMKSEMNRDTEGTHGGELDCKFPHGKNENNDVRIMQI